MALPPTRLHQAVYPLSVMSDDNPNTGPQLMSVIGIAVAVGGNVLISLALNCQKLAHKRLETSKHSRHFPPTPDTLPDDRYSGQNGTQTQPLLSGPPSPSSYTTPKRSLSRSPSYLLQSSAPIQVTSVTQHTKHPKKGEGGNAWPHNETDYLRSKLWLFCSTLWVCVFSFAIAIGGLAFSL